MKGLVLALFAATSLLTWGNTEVSFLFSYFPERGEDPTTRAINALAARERLDPVKWGGLILPGAGGRSTFMLALAGGTAPDIYKAWFHILRHDIEQGFVHPLDEFIDPSELKYEGDDIWEKVRRKDGHVWALPTPGTAYYGLVYRKDLVSAAGLDPAEPPLTWREFREWCVKLTKDGCRALAIENRPWGFLPWVQSACGEVTTETEATFDSPGAVKAAEFLQELVRLGVVRGMPTLTVADEVGRLFSAGEIAIVFGGEDLVTRLTDTLDFPSELIGVMPFPAADEGGRRVLQAHRHFFAMSESAGRRSESEREKIFLALKTLADPALADEQIRRNVAEGRTLWCRPRDLERLGFHEELATMPPEAKRMYEDLDRGEITAVTEPWVGFWQGASDLIMRHLLGVLLSDAGATMDVEAALKAVNLEANRGLMFEADRSGIERARPYARVILGALLVCALIAAAIGWRRRTAACFAAERDGRRGFDWRPWLFLAPAVASILVWSYYPLLKGALMAFQEYRIVGSVSWAGLDNFIRVATDPTFWTSWLRTLEYVAITLALGFVTPIVLAIMLCEIPRGKIFFRFLYFLPHLTSALVVTLLWKLMFDPTENGILNQALAAFGVARHTWLQDPSWAMVCCIIPGVWAGAGISSLIYIAALGSMSPDYYEAAAIDGAGFFGRLRHVTIPQLAPLMIINFVGAFIAAFQGMGSIFLLTFGGPGDATQVVSLQIWKEAYNNLRFSTATTMAWFLGFALIGFTVLQIRFLRKVEFRKAGES